MVQTQVPPIGKQIPSKRQTDDIAALDYSEVNPNKPFHKDAAHAQVAGQPMDDIESTFDMTRGEKGEEELQ
jgi:hypothetical protein